MKISVSQQIELTEAQVREIVRKFLRERYQLLKTFDMERYVEGPAVFEIQYDTRGREISRTSKGASPQEIAADIILKSI